MAASACQGLLDYLNSQYRGQYGNDVYGGLLKRLFGDGNDRKHQINRILNFVIPSILIEEEAEFEEPRLRYRVTVPEPVADFLAAVTKLVYEEVICSPSVQHLEFKGQMMVIAVFEVIKSEPKRFLPGDILAKFSGSAEPMRVISDYVSGMTDAHLLLASALVV